MRLCRTYAIGTATRDDGYFRASDAMDVHYTEMLSLETEGELKIDIEALDFWTDALDITTKVVIMVI